MIQRNGLEKFYGTFFFSRVNLSLRQFRPTVPNVTFHSVHSIVTFVALCCGTALGIILPLHATEDAPTKPAAQQRAEHLERMRKLAQSITVFEMIDDHPVKGTFIPQPILAYRDDTRQQDDSTMWVWKSKGRPSALLAIEFYPQNPVHKRWLFEIASLSSVHISAERGKDLHWQSRRPGLDLQIIPDAPIPAEKATARLAQMRQLRRRFTAHEVEGTNGRIELQPLAAPLYRYHDADQGILDGAIFAFANGTNPEVLWIVEAHSTVGSPVAWHFGLAQMSGAAVFAKLDHKQIWTRMTADVPTASDSYINGWLSADVEPDQQKH